MKKILTLIVVLLLAVIGYAQDPFDPGIKDTVSFCNVKYYVSPEPPFSGTIKIEIWLYNDSNSEEYLGDVQLVLRWTGPVQFDSGSFLGSKVDSTYGRAVNIDNTEKNLKAIIFSYWPNWIPPWKGRLFTLFGTVTDTGTVTIDTTSFIRNQSWVETCFTPLFLYCFYPVFKKLEFRIRPDSLMGGDVSQNGQLGLEDIIGLVNYLFRGERLFLRQIMDVNADCVVNLVDLVFLANYIFKSGREPVYGCAC